jgi:predicted TPR repeat methyltransferase
MDKAALRKHLQALANGKRSANAPLVVAYLADEHAEQVARLLVQAAGSTHPGKTPLLPPSSCLPMLD